MTINVSYTKIIVDCIGYFMKFRVQNLITGNFISEPTTQIEADKICERLNWSGKKYKSVAVELETERLSHLLKPMSEEVKRAISKLNKISFPPRLNHSNFASAMNYRINAEKKFEISEKEEAFLWHLVHKYRRQILDQQLIQISLRRKVY